VAVVIITGCSSGFGLATALAFARRGDRVHATMRNPHAADDLSAAAAAEGLRLELRALDVTDASSVAQAVGGVLEADGRIDVLVNNAGIARMGAVEALGIDEARSVFETNLFGPLRLIQAVLPAMRGQGEGVVVNVSSMAGRLPGSPANWAYSASKHALESLSDSLAEEVRPFGIRVVCVEPGFFRTDVVRKGGRLPKASPYRDLEKQAAAWYASGVATGGDPAVVAAAIVAAVEDPASPLHLPVGADAVSAISGGS